MMDDAPPLPTGQAGDEARHALLFGTAVAGALLAFAARRRSAVGTAAGIAGAGVLASFVVPRLAPRLSDAIAPHRPIDIRADFVIARPVREVFAFFRNFENFPLLGTVLHSVHDYDDGRSHWRVVSRGGSVEWDVVVTKYLPPRVLAWESVPGSPVECAGTVRFVAADAGTTQLFVEIHYRPVTDVAARAFRPLLGRIPKRRLRNAIARIDDAMQHARDRKVVVPTSSFPLPPAPVPSTPSAPPSPPAPPAGAPAPRSAGSDDSTLS